MRRVPELRFQQDRSLEHARRIERILSDVLPDGGDGADDGDGDPAAGESGDGEEDPTR